jgi:N-acyl-D-aspartate/D-glutamate deacylase
MELGLNNGYILNIEGNIEKLNIGIDDGIIKKISSKYIEAKKQLDVEGLLIAPGIIDVHMDREGLINCKTSNCYEGKALLRMGVTSAIGGNCGYNLYPLKNYKKNVMTEGVPQNVGVFVGYNTLRSNLEIGRYQKANTSQINTIQKMLKDSFKEGVFGLSVGLAFHPGISVKELLSMSRVVAEYDAYLSVQLITEPNNLIPSLKEIINISRKTGVRLQLSHIGSIAAYGHMNEFLSTLESAVDSGIQARGDCYPYSSFSTEISSPFFDEGFEDRLKCKIEDLQIAEGEYKGRRCDYDLFYKLKKEKPNTLIIAHVMNEEEVIEALRHPYILIASDINLHKNEGHPRAVGTYPRFLGHYCRDQGILSMMCGIKKITSNPAYWYQFKNKGRIIEGVPADLVVFDPNKIIDRSTCLEPITPPLGIKYTILNGYIVVEDNRVNYLNKGRWLNYDHKLHAISGY